MRYAVIENNTVVNIAMADADFATAQGWVLLEGENSYVEIGVSYVDGIFSNNTPPILVVVPEYVAMWQARDFLIANNLLDDVLAVIDSIQDPVAKKRAQSKFEFSNTVRRDDPLLNYVCTSAGFSSEDVDNWFIEANRA